ncbi:MAG: hypothetical protein ABJE66_31745 [Deltaproteobacteria bacterium]
MKAELSTIDSTTLDLVTGGTGMNMPMPTGSTSGASSTSTGSSSSSGSTNDALMTSLNSISSALKDLGKNNGGLFGGNNAMMFLMMGLMFSQRNEVVVYGGHGCAGWGGQGHGWG